MTEQTNEKKGERKKTPENATRVEIESVWKTKQRERGREEATRAGKKRESQRRLRREEADQDAKKGTTTRLG